MKRILLALFVFALSISFSQTINLVSPADAIDDQPVRIKFRWLHDGAYKNYEVEFDTTSNFSSSAERLISDGIDYSSLNNGDTITQQDSNFYFGKKYYWRVRGVNGNVTSGWTSTRSFTVRSATVLLSPVDGDIVTSSYNVLFRCENVLGATQYQFQVGSTNVFISPIYDHIIQLTTYNYFDKSQLGYFVTSITTNGDFYVRVRAISYVDSSAWSNVAKFTFAVSNVVEEIHVVANVAYPNPTAGNLNIKQDGVTQLLVFNMQGEEVMRINNSSSIKTLDVSHLSDGMYQMLLFSGDTIYAQKINVVR